VAQERRGRGSGPVAKISKEMTSAIKVGGRIDNGLWQILFTILKQRFGF
jgi:hypothetical protein